ncbi:hypothetical protein [Sulfurisphaera tokodaii]|uniref:Uncharacterized protein n=2 Tax=Sulfurisphaera tokodaii TaxID=111955 RepID=Q974Q6_SULTO|nr:hypothetical protein [Sulfurisphaera tokodaii]BAB65601.1 hypothetical protein STK_06030 [Sulfurisphaera tokodaii str. 7]HII74697.1 hypothetical protein [Sulfurisphaera tokodaii]
MKYNYLFFLFISLAKFFDILEFNIEIPLFTYLIILNNILIMTDLASYIVIRRTYENFKSELSMCSNVKELKLKIQKFLSFLSSFDFEIETKLKEFVSKQKEIAKKLLLIINIRYVIIFIYKYIVNKLLSELINLINVVLRELNYRGF